MRQQETAIIVIIGNPPYNVGQINENDNNKNREYPAVSQRVRETYSRDSDASNRNALSDIYVKFFRWATDRLGDRDGVICFVSNNSFLHGFAFDGFRKHIAQDFTHIYHLDMGGNMRKGGRGSVFGIRVGVGITILVRKREDVTSPGRICTYVVDDTLSGDAKLTILKKLQNYTHLEWETLQPDERHTWLTKGLHAEFDRFIPMGTKKAKAAKSTAISVLFQNYGCGISTGRDAWAYNYQREVLIMNIRRFITTYNSEVDRWKRAEKNIHVDDFVRYDDTQMKWSEGLKNRFIRELHATFQEKNVRRSLYRPFCRQYLYFDRALIERVYQFPAILPTPETEAENVLIWLKVGSDWPMFALATNIIPDLLPQGGSQCFPFYTYDENDAHRQENITDWALSQFRAICGDHVTKWDIFYYVYAVLHHPTYRTRYAENLKRDLPHIPLPTCAEAFTTLAAHGKELADLHIDYEQAAEYPLELQQNRGVPCSWRIEKMRLSKDKQSIMVNASCTLHGVPPECFDYQLGNRSALEWVIDQYQVKTDSRSKITNDPNRPHDPQYIVRLIRRVVMVSVATIRIVHKIATVDVGTMLG